MTSTSANRRGILAMLAAMIFFVGNDTLLKLASTNCPPGQIMAVRGLFASMLALGLVAAWGELRHLKGIASPLVLGRAGVEAAVAFLYITSLAVLPLANITAILQATPIILTLMAVALGIERVGWRRWSAILLGFSGVLLVVKPSPSAFNLYAGLALSSAVLVAVRDLATRFIGGHVPTLIVTLSTTTAVGLAGLALGMGEVWQPLGRREVMLLLAAAVLVTLGNLSIITAFRVADVSTVSPFRYSIVIFSIVLGFLVFDEWPDRASAFGIALIVGSGLYTIHREQVRLREALGRHAAPPTKRAHS